MRRASARASSWSNAARTRRSNAASIFASAVTRHFPDRHWRIRDRERAVVLGEFDEQSGFVPFPKVPPAALARRRSTRKASPRGAGPAGESALAPQARSIEPREHRASDPRFDALTEIFRLDLRRWLTHTDDAKRKIVFADPVEQRLCSAPAPRVYNVGVVCRLRRRDDDDAPWQRIRVVVSRKGIRRIDHIA